MDQARVREEGRMNIETLNLLPPGRRSALRIRRRTQVWTLIAAGYGIATLGACITLAAGEPVVDRGEAKELATLTRAADQFRTLTEHNKKSITQERVKLVAKRLVADHPDWSILLDLLAATRGAEVVVEGVEVSPAPPLGSDDPGKKRPPQAAGAAHVERSSIFDIKLTGFARTQSAVTDFADRLQREGVFDSVTLSRSSARAMGESSVIDFILQCRIGASSADAKKGMP